MQRRDPVDIPATHPIIQEVIAIISRILHRKIQLTSMPYTTDASIFVQQMRVPVVIFGPGKPELAHKADGYVELEMVRNATDTYTALMLGL